MKGGPQRLVAAYLRLPRVLRWGAVVVWMTGIWWLSSKSGKGGPSSWLWSLVSNGGHLVLFGGLAALLYLAGPGSATRRSALAVGIATAYAVVDELHQGTVPGRDPSVADVVTDLCGAVLACCVLMRMGERVPAWARHLALPVAVVAAVSVVWATLG